MPVALRRLKDAMQEIRRPFVPAGARLPLTSVTRGRLGGAAAFLTGALAAFLWSNTTVAASYRALRDATLSVAAGGAALTLDLRSFVNDGLMTVFFFSVALSARRQFAAVAGAGRSSYLVPFVAAAGALFLPALLAFLAGGPSVAAPALALGGFDLGLALVAWAAAQESPEAGHPVFAFSASLDAMWIAALVFIGARGVSAGWLAACGTVAGVAWLARWLGARGAAWGLLSGVLIWLTWRKAGLMPAVAGALMAMLVPARTGADERRATELAEDALDDYDRAMDDADPERCSGLARRIGDIAMSVESPLDRWQTGVQPWLVWIVLPLFGFVNGGIAVAEGPSWTRAAVVLAAAFLIGRPAGAILFGWIARRRTRVESSLSGMPRLLEISCVSLAGGVPAVIGAVAVFPSVAAAGPFVLPLIALSLAGALVASLLFRFVDFGA